MDWAGPSTSSAFGAGNVSNAPNAITTGANLAPMPRFRHKKSASDTFAWATASYLEADPFDLLNSSDVRPPELGGQNPWEMPSTVHNAHRRGSSGVPGISVMPGDFAKRNSSDGIKLECGNASLLQWGATASVSGFGAGADVKSAHPGHRRGISLDGEPHTGFSKTMKDGLATEKPLPNFATQTRANAFDPSQLDPKRAKRIIANRQSAHRSRVKKLQLVHAMEGEIELLAKESKMLEDENIRLEDVQKELHRSARLLHQEVVQKTRQAAQKQELQTAIRKELAQLTQMMSSRGISPLTMQSQQQQQQQHYQQGQQQQQHYHQGQQQQPEQQQQKQQHYHQGQQQHQEQKQQENCYHQGQQQQPQQKQEEQQHYHQGQQQHPQQKQQGQQHYFQGQQQQPEQQQQEHCYHQGQQPQPQQQQQEQHFYHQGQQQQPQQKHYQQGQQQQPEQKGQQHCYHQGQQPQQQQQEQQHYHQGQQQHQEQQQQQQQLYHQGQQQHPRLLSSLGLEEKIMMDFAGGIDMDSPSSSLGLPRLMSPATTRPEVGFDDGGLQNSLMPIAEIPESPTLDLRNQEALAMDVGSLVPGALNMNLSLLSADQEMLRSLLSIPSGDDMPGLPFS